MTILFCLLVASNQVVGGPNPSGRATITWRDVSSSRAIERVLRYSNAVGCRVSAMTQRVHKERKSWRGLATARVIRVVARKGRAPILEHPLETPLC